MCKGPVVEAQRKGGLGPGVLGQVIQSCGSLEYCEPILPGNLDHALMVKVGLARLS